MPLHLPILLFVKAARKVVDKLDEAASVGDPDYHTRCQGKHFIPKLPFVVKNGVLRLVGQGPQMSPEEEEAWRAAAAAAKAEAEAAAERKRELRAQERAAKREFKAEEKAAKRQSKAEQKAAKDAGKAARRAEKEQRRAAARGA